LKIDVDVHVPSPPIEWLRPYMSNYWADYTSLNGFAGLEEVVRLTYPNVFSQWGPDGPCDTAEAYLNRLRSAVFESGKADYAIAICCSGLEIVQHPDLAAELARSLNDWLRAEFLDREPRLGGSIVVPPQHPDLAAAEVRRVGENPSFLQVLLPVRSARPYGHRDFFPMFDAIASLGLTVGLHFGGSTGSAPTASGYPSTYIEEYVGMAQAAQTQINSLLSSGVFARLPSLRFALLECGFAWVPSVMWALDKRWKGLRREIPWVSRPPSDYLREHFKASMQPLDIPLDALLLHEVLDDIGCKDFIMYSSDFPHREPSEAAGLVGLFDVERQDALLSRSAEATYGSIRMNASKGRS
jgi:predicted TIM-barrel fold metal-dependent hydrolase